MDVSRFIDALKKGSLFFSRADRFQDPFEGAIPKAVYDRVKSRVERSLDTLDERKKELEHLLSFCQELKKKFFVSCWHTSEYQSEAMWRLYARPGPVDTIAVRTKFKNLRETMPSFVSFAPVHYGDPEHDQHTARDFHEYILSILIKRKSFEHEKEARFFFQNMDLSGYLGIMPIEGIKGGTGFHVKVDLHGAVEQVYIRAC
jgi:hypothetical protein